MRIRAYASTVGVLLLLAALLGVAGIVPTKGPTEIFHAGVGLIFAYLGFLQRDAEIVRTVVGGMGIILVVVKAIVFVLPLLLGESPFWGPIEITCLLIGVLSILASRYLREDGTAEGG